MIVPIKADVEGDSDPRLQRVVYRPVYENCFLCNEKLVPWPD